MITSVSVGFRIGCVRVATVARSERMSLSPADGISNRSSRPRESIAAVAASGPSGFWMASSYTFVASGPDAVMSCSSTMDLTLIFTSAEGAI